MKYAHNLDRIVGRFRIFSAYLWLNDNLRTTLISNLRRYLLVANDELVFDRNLNQKMYQDHRCLYRRLIHDDLVVSEDVSDVDSRN